MSDDVSAMLQVWPEPKLHWQATKSVILLNARDDLGQILAARPSAPVQPPLAVGFVKNVQGVIVNGGGADIPTAPAPTFRPNALQAILNLKPGPKPSTAL